MNSEAQERACPECGSSGVEDRGGSATVIPRPVTDVLDLNHGRKVIRWTYRCRECGHEYFEKREIEF